MVLAHLYFYGVHSPTEPELKILLPENLLRGKPPSGSPSATNKGVKPSTAPHHLSPSCVTHFNGVILKELSVKHRNFWYCFSCPKCSAFGLMMVPVIYGIEQVVILIQTKLSEIYINYFQSVERV